MAPSNGFLYKSIVWFARQDRRRGERPSPWSAPPLRPQSRGDGCAQCCLRRGRATRRRPRHCPDTRARSRSCWSSCRCAAAHLRPGKAVRDASDGLAWFWHLQSHSHITTDAQTRRHFQPAAGIQSFSCDHSLVMRHRGRLAAQAERWAARRWAASFCLTGPQQKGRLPSSAALSYHQQSLPRKKCAACSVAPTSQSMWSRWGTASCPHPGPCTWSLTGSSRHVRSPPSMTCIC